MRAFSMAKTVQFLLRSPYGPCTRTTNIMVLSPDESILDGKGGTVPVTAPALRIKMCDSHVLLHGPFRLRSARPIGVGNSWGVSTNSRRSDSYLGFSRWVVVCFCCHWMCRTQVLKSEITLLPATYFVTCMQGLHLRNQT